MANTTFWNSTVFTETIIDSSSEPPPALRTHYLFGVAILIWRICPPVILLFGIFGNTMTILVMRRLHGTGSTMNVFFQALAVSDLTLLCVDTLPKWLSNVFGTTALEDFHSITCKLYKMVIYAAGVLSPWLLVALTVQRAASVLWPHRVNAVWTKRKSRNLVIAMVVSITLFHSHYLYGFDITEHCKNNIVLCCPGESDWYHWFHIIVWPWVDLLEFSLLPFALLVVSNTVLVWRVLASLREARSTLAVVQSGASSSRDKKVSSLTLTLVTLSVSFLILTTPISLYLITRPYLLTPATFMKDMPLTAAFDVFWAAGNIMWYTNSAVNFYLYCLTGTKFRAEFKAIMSGCFFIRQPAITSGRRSVTSSTMISSTVVSTGVLKDEPSKSAGTEADF